MKKQFTIMEPAALRSIGEASDPVPRWPKWAGPRGIALMCAAMKANETLCPVAVRMESEYLKDGRLTGRSTRIVLRQDADHISASTLEYAGSSGAGQSLYLNGPDCVTYDPDENEYDASPFTPRMVGYTNEHLRYRVCMIIQRARRAAAHPHSRVTPVLFGGVAATEVILKNRREKNSMALYMVTAVISNADGLPLQVTVKWRDGGVLRTTYAYERPAMPFPASAFIFTPPEDAREAPNED